MVVGATQNSMRLDMLERGWQHGPEMSTRENAVAVSRAPSLDRDWIRTAPSPFPSPPQGGEGAEGGENSPKGTLRALDP